MQPKMIIPRDELLDEGIKNILKGRSSWYVGHEGLGKSTIIQEAVDELEDGFGREVIVCEQSSQFKPLMMDIAKQLHERHFFNWDKIPDAEELNWDKLHAKLYRPPVVEVAPVVLQCLEGKDIILVLDHLERVGPTYQQFYAKLFEVCTVIAASSNFQNPQVKKLRSYARVIEVPKFTEEQAVQLSDFLFEHHKINAHDEDNFKLHILRAADGIPSKLVQLYEDASTEKYIEEDYIRRLRSKAGREYTNMGWLLLVIITLPMAAKIIAVGSGDKDGFIAFGVLGSFSLIMRFLILKGSRNPS